MFGIINKKEKQFLEKIASNNTGENSLWKIPNIIIPLAAIIAALIIYVLFSISEFDTLVFINLVMNGCLPLIALNQISFLGTHIFKYDKSKEKDLGIGSIYYLRTKLDYMLRGIFVIGLLMYAYQVVKSPFDSYITISISLILSVLLIVISSKTSKKVFLLQEHFINHTYDAEMRDGSDELTANFE